MLAVLLLEDGGVRNYPLNRGKDIKAQVTELETQLNGQVAEVIDDVNEYSDFEIFEIRRQAGWYNPGSEYLKILARERQLPRGSS